MRSQESDDHQLTTFQVEVSTDTARLHTDTQPSLWPTASSEQRDALVALVTDALGHMQSSVAEWLPAALVARSHTRFAVTISWENGILDEEILRRKLAAEDTRRERVADLLRMSETTSE